MRHKAKDTLTAVEMDRGEIEEFERVCGEVVRIELVSTQARVLRTTLQQPRVEEDGARTDYCFNCVLKINGLEHVLEREVSTPRSFYEPWEIQGVRIWFDAVRDIFDFLGETHGECRPRKRARFAIQDATLRICPEPLHPWLPLPPGGLRIEDCYRGEDCWLGAYNGASAHGGLDINHPKGAPLWAPLDIDDHFYFNSLATGHRNNGWRGIHRWSNGAEWILDAYHMTELTVPERQPIRKGRQFAWGAGVFSGCFEHSHFVFKIHDYGETILLDPWILFWQMYQDQKADHGMQAYRSATYCAPRPPTCCSICTARGVTCQNSFDRARAAGRQAPGTADCS